MKLKNKIYYYIAELELYGWKLTWEPKENEYYYMGFKNNSLDLSINFDKQKIVTIDWEHPNEYFELSFEELEIIMKIIKEIKKHCF